MFIFTLTKIQPFTVNVNVNVIYIFNVCLLLKRLSANLNVTGNESTISKYQLRSFKNKLISLSKFY